jgi:DNA-directed RNA polymerase, mitochondrial
MRFKDSSEQELYLKEATNAGTVELVYAGLDVLGSTPWKINKAIFDVVVAVWNSGERMGKMPPAVFDQPVPEPPENMDDLEERSHHIIRHRVWAQNKANTHSERCGVNYRVEIARAVSNPSLRLSHSLNFLCFPLLFSSSLETPSISPTTWISEDAHTPFHHI